MQKNVGASIIIGVPEHDQIDYVEQKVKSYNIKLAIHNHGPEDKMYPNPADENFCNRQHLFQSGSVRLTSVSLAALTDAFRQINCSTKKIIFLCPVLKSSVIIKV